MITVRVFSLSIDEQRGRREFCSCEVGGKKSATLLVPFQAVCWDMSFVSVRPIDASGLTPLTLCEALVFVFPRRGKKNVCNVHIRGDS